MEIKEKQTVFIVVNSDNNIADSAEPAIVNSIEEADYVVDYLRFECDLEDEDFTILEAEMTLDIKARHERRAEDED